MHSYPICMNPLSYIATKGKALNILLMGNSNAEKETQSHYAEIRIEENELLSTLMIVEDQRTKEKLMAKQLNIANELEYSRMLKELRARKAMSERKLGKHLIQIREVESRESSEICGKNFKIIMYLEYLESSLRSIYNDRVRQAQPFEEEQVLNILKSLVSSLIILHDNNYKNLHLYKETILLSAHSTFKIMDTQLSPKVHPYYEILNRVPTKKGTYLAPELLREILNSNGDFYHTTKADIFTLAIIILELCTFASYDAYYDYENMTVDLEGLAHAVEYIKYSEHLKSILGFMLAEEEEDRIGLITLQELLVGSDMKNFEESSTFKSVSTNPRKKNTTRTFISRSKPEDKSKESSLQKVKTEFNLPKEKKSFIPVKASSESNRFFQGEYSSQREVFNKEGYSQGNSKNSQVSNQIVYKPIEPISHEARNPFDSLEVKQTPRSSFNCNNNLSHKLKLREFQTPVNLLYHHPEPQSTPIRKIEALGSAHQPTHLHYDITKPNSDAHQFSTIQLKGNGPSQAPLNTQYFNDKSYGKHVFSNGARYEGQFNSKGEFQGNGMLYYPEGKLCYSGSWKGNSFHGFGVLYNEIPTESGEPSNYENLNFVDRNNWNYYEGEFDDDRKEGFGTLYMANGDKFSGCFRDDAVEGFGTFYLAKLGQNVNGIWVKNVLKK